MNDKDREDFEAWLASKYVGYENALIKNSKGEYVWGPSEMQWEVWQAARASQAAAPVAWLRNTVDPQPHAVTDLKYRSIADVDAGVQYVPVYASAAQASITNPLSKDFIQDVPDKCDRIVWRGSYYNLPLHRLPVITKDQIRQVFSANGFTVKTGETDLKPYVFEAAYALIRLATLPDQTK